MYKCYTEEKHIDAVFLYLESGITLVTMEWDCEFKINKKYVKRKSCNKIKVMFMNFSFNLDFKFKIRRFYFYFFVKHIKTTLVKVKQITSSDGYLLLVDFYFDIRSSSYR